MSRKSNRLKNRLRIWEERLAGIQRRERVCGSVELLLGNQQNELRAQRLALDLERKKLERSVALRIKVQREFDQAYGEIWAINIRLHPHEFKLAAVGEARRNIGAGIVPVNASRWAEMKGREAGQQIAQVIERVIVDGPQQWEGL